MFKNGLEMVSMELKSDFKDSVDWGTLVKQNGTAPRAFKDLTARALVEQAECKRWHRPWNF